MTIRQGGASGPGLEQEIRQLAARFDLAELYVFGSRAAEIAARVRGQAVIADAPPGSDVDVGVRPLPGIRLHVDALVSIAQELERLLDVHRVDVVLLPTAGAFLALDVIRGELLYVADHDAQCEYELYVLRRAGDLAPFQRARQELALSRYRET